MVVSTASYGAIVLRSKIWMGRMKGWILNSYSVDLDFCKLVLFLDLTCEIKVGFWCPWSSVTCPQRQFYDNRKLADGATNSLVKGRNLIFGYIFWDFSVWTGRGRLLAGQGSQGAVADEGVAG
jgi:hypothetical protein